jgi:hypothetical protein
MYIIKCYITGKIALNMDPREKQRIRRNEKFLRDNVKVNDVIPHLIQHTIITVDDAERIGKEVTASDKVNRLLRILETHPNGYTPFIEALTENNMGFITKKLEGTEIDENNLQQGTYNCLLWKTEWAIKNG